ncbi:RNA-directed DNA polymerase, eukaryota [Tanacetum coccineum]|uniref:RNA-directed DNA polymerase, eukaryota n=1 Tax=Tanacetum coccineum TaxID=301880 RepID=A0ABQ4YKD1_9ASTR
MKKLSHAHLYIFDVLSWFFLNVTVSSFLSTELIPASNSFVNDDRIVWVSVEGLPIKALTRNTFAKILSPWGDFIDVEEPANISLSYKKICVKTKNHVIINDRIKIIIEGKVYWIRVKELEPWIPDFNHELEDNSSSDEESEGDISEQDHETKKNGAESDNDLEIDHVSETSYMNENDVVTDNHVSESGFTPTEVENLAAEINVGTSEVTPSLGQSTKKRWIQELNSKHKINFIALQETKMELIDLITIKELWGILLLTMLLVRLLVSLEDLSDRKALWDFIRHLVDSWSGESIILGDFNEVRSENERFGSIFYENGANAFNHFITRAGLIDLPLEGYSFTWTHPSASKMSKLDRFLVSEGMIVVFPSLSAICLERHLSDHMPILLRELDVDYGPSLFRLYHSWFSKDGFDDLVEQTWKSPIPNESNSIILLKKKFQVLKASIKQWCKKDKQHSNSSKSSIQARLADLDNDHGKGNVVILNERATLLKDLLDLNAKDSLDMAQKAKIRWSVEGDENSKFFHEIINKKRSQLVIRGIFVEGKFPYGCNASFITLIPKTQDSKLVKDFRPISLIGKWEKSNISTLVNVLNCFSMASGLKMNLHKNKLMGIGVKVGGIPSRHNFWEEVIVKISARLSKWKLKTLSIGGRFTLTKAVLSSIPLYQMSMYRVPMGVLNRLESTRRDFFQCIFAQNQALMLKWIWRFMSNDSSLWSRFIKAMFGVRGSLVDTVYFHWCSNWLDINRELQSMSRQGLNLLSHAKLKVGDGTNTLFWNDVWLAESPLNLCYPRLFSLEDDKLISISDKLQAPSLLDSFRRPTRGGIEDSQLTFLAQDLTVVVLSSKKDRWVWSLNSLGLFYVKSARAFIDNIFLPHLPTRLNLSLLGIDIPSIICPICSIAVLVTLSNQRPWDCQGGFVLLAASGMWGLPGG